MSLGWLSRIFSSAAAWLSRVGDGLHADGDVHMALQRVVGDGVDGVDDLAVVVEQNRAPAGAAGTLLGEQMLGLVQPLAARWCRARGARWLLGQADLLTSSGVRKSRWAKAGSAGRSKAQAKV